MESSSLLKNIGNIISSNDSVDCSYVYTIEELKYALSHHHPDFIITQINITQLSRIIGIAKYDTARLIIVSAGFDIKEYSIFSKGRCASLHEAIPFEIKIN